MSILIKLVFDRVNKDVALVVNDTTISVIECDEVISAGNKPLTCFSNAIIEVIKR